MYCCQYIHSPDFIGEFPLDILPLPTLHPALKILHPKNMKQYAGMRIILAVAQQRGKTRRSNTEFFLEFPNQRLFRRFAGFDFSTRKFPLPGTGLVGQTLLNQQFTDGILYYANSDRDSIRIGSLH